MIIMSHYIFFQLQFKYFRGEGVGEGRISKKLYSLHHTGEIKVAGPGQLNKE